LVGKPEGNKPLARARRRWNNNINLCLKEREWVGADNNISLTYGKNFYG
jgi:hypothetical protein